MWEYVVVAIVVILVVIIIIIWVTSASTPSPQETTQEMDVLTRFNSLEEGSRDYCYFLHMLLLARREGEDVSELKQRIKDASVQMSRSIGHYYILGEQYLNYFKEKADLLDRQMVHFVKCTHSRVDDTCQAQNAEQSMLSGKIASLFHLVNDDVQKEIHQALSAFDTAFSETIVAVNKRNVTLSVCHARKALDCLKLVNATLFEHLDTVAKKE